MSSLTGKSLNPVMNRRSVIASAAGLGAMSILAGCSSNGGDSGSASSDASFKIGTIGPLTGANASYGKSVTQGVELGCKDFSTKELPLASKAEDDQADGEKAVNAFNTLLDWGMQALVGPTTTGASVAVAAECGNDPKTFMITPSASSEDVTDGKDCVFQVCFTDPNQGVNAAKFLAQKYADEKFVLFYNSGDAYSSGIADSFKAQAAKSKLEIVDEETFKDDSATSFTNQLTKAKQAGATMIFAPIYYTPASVLLKNAKDMGYDVKMMGCDGMDGILTQVGFAPALAEGVMLLTPFNAAATDEATVNFVPKYQELYGETPNQFAADAYDCVYAYKMALEAAGCTPAMGNEELCDALIATFPTITLTGLTGDGAGITWDASGEVSKSPKGMVIENGAYVGMD